MASPPRIGISGRVATVDAAARTGVNAAYVASVAAGGGLPLVLSPLAGPDAADALLDGLDGLLLTGGDDLDPAAYGAAPHPKLGPLDPPRDAFEFALYRAARARGRPVLAICRGLQLVNVAHGGTLVQDLPSERPGPVRHAATGRRDARSHPVRLGPGSRVAQACGTGAFDVNSFHHQAIDRLGAGLTVTGHAPDGVVEACEADTGAWMVAVQWHPEELTAAPGPDAALFAAFVRAATN